MSIRVNEKEFAEAIASFKDMADSIDERYLKNRQAYYARKHFIPDMRRNSPSKRLERMISVTTAKKWAPPNGIRIGVVKNDPADFPDVSAQGLASMLEHGTEERFRKLVTAGIVTGRVHLGKIKAAPHKGRTSFLRAPYDRNVEAFMKDVEDALTEKVMKEA